MIILYIDDDNEDQELFFEAINIINSTYTCVLASSGKEGLNILKSITPDRIFLDMNMPQMNGRDVLQRIRAQKRLDPIPVVIFSTSITDADKKEFRRSGATDCLVKPSSFSMLCNTLKSYLN